MFYLLLCNKFYKPPGTGLFILNPLTSHHFMVGCIPPNPHYKFALYGFLISEPLRK